MQESAFITLKTRMPSIRSLETMSPAYKVSKSEIPEVANVWLANDELSKEKYKRISSNSGVENRYYIQPWQETLKLGGLEARTSIFEEMGEPLLRSAVNKALETSSIDPADIGYLLFTSCSVPVIPSIDAKVILNTNLPRTINRLPIFQHGCVGGVVGLSMGSRLAQLGKPVIVTSLELCSLVFQGNNTAGSQLVGASIFADGAAAMIIDPGQGEINFVDSMSYLIPDSRHLMGYDIHDDGFHLRLDRNLPSVLTKEAPQLVNAFLAKHELTTKDVDYWLFHPGGKKILDYFEETFELEKERCCWARDVLRDNGNMSSATILFVMKRFMETSKLEKGQKALVVGIGPGLTIELVLFEG